MRARPANPEDAVAMARIYNAGIGERIATFETRPRSPEEMVHRPHDPYPAVVVVEDEAVVSFAAASAYSPRECYSGIAEFSVYTDPGHRGRGAGKLAMEALIQALGQAGFHKLVSRVFTENAPSRAMLRSLGFREVGTHRRHARLDGAWRDVVLVERLL